MTGYNRTLWVCKQNVWQKDVEGHIVKIKWRKGTVAFFTETPDLEYWSSLNQAAGTDFVSTSSDHGVEVAYEKNSRMP